MRSSFLASSGSTSTAASINKFKKSCCQGSLSTTLGSYERLTITTTKTSNLHEERKRLQEKATRPLRKTLCLGARLDFRASVIAFWKTRPGCDAARAALLVVNVAFNLDISGVRVRKDMVAVS